MRYSVVAPLSHFTEALRGVKVALDSMLGDKPTKIVGIISVLPNEGKSTVSKNFASLVAHLGMRTLLIDADLRNPGLTRILAPRAEKGLLEALKGERQMREISFIEPESGLTFLPSVSKDRITHTSELLASPQMQLLIDDLQHYDFIVIDLPPLGPVIDAKVAAKIVDAFVFVVEWGATARDFVANTLATEREIAEKCAGVLLNKVDMAIVGRYQSDALKEYYYSRYGNYYGRKASIKALPMKPPGRRI
jgi:succinoglycan biosynthesis transport protein ExoP